MPIPGHPYVDADPDVCGGKPVLTGTRIRVLDILEMFGGGMTEVEILADFPQLSAEAIRGALNYAAESQRHRVVLLAAE